MKKSKKFTKILSLTLALCCLVTATVQPVQASAASNNNVISTEKISQDDGGYILVTTLNLNSNSSGISTCATTHSRKASRVFSYYNALNTLCWSYTLNATFLYDGTLVACTEATSSASIYKSNWSFSNESHSRKGNVATGSITFKNSTVSKTITLTITCAKDGTIS